jgi:chemotaxis methyl-accepting protein methylase
MIYFDDKTKRKIMKELHATLFRGGWLLLGGAESIFGLDEWFERRTVGNTTIYIAR